MNGSNVKALCNICHGTGYAVSNIIVSDYDPDTPIQIEFHVKMQRTRRFGNPVFPSIYSEADMSRFDSNEYGCNVDSVRDIVTGFWEKYPEMEENRIGLYMEQDKRER
ncbi:MAG: hypothetical protein V8S58_13640 [Lachnospiraceae bacterium]